jgi:hypothetical protein
MLTETFTAGEDFTVPNGVFSLEVELEGEAGESAGGGAGSGGRVVGDVSTVPGEMFRIRETAGGSSSFGGSGGAAIDIRLGGTTLSDRLVVGAGGGGAGSGSGGGSGGAGGADTGADGSAGGSQFSDAAGEGGTQSAGGTGGAGSTDGQDGSFGTGGDGGNDNRDGGGGGGGWYGGGGGAGDVNTGIGDGGAGGGGGSNYDDGLDTVTANERGTSTRSFGEGGLVTITYEQTPGAENLAITDTTATSNTLDWDAPTLPPEVDSIDQYRIYRDTDTGTDRVDYTEIDTTPDVGYTDMGLDNGIEYHYRIGADLVVN